MNPIERRIEVVPQKFCFQDRSQYPPLNSVDFEYWFFRTTRNDEIPAGWTYLPLTWTASYKVAGYGKDQNRLDDIQLYLNTLDRSKKYFTIIQYDDGILNKVSHLNLRVYSMSGNPAHYKLPLICQIPLIRRDKKIERDLLASFVGRVTHPIRQEMLSGLPEGQTNKYYISTYGHTPNDYYEILARSVFALAPRGYGPSSFRIAEALHFGAIPVYISDVFFESHGLDFSQYGIKIEAMDAHRVSEILSSITPEEIQRRQQSISAYYNNYFTYSANKTHILNDLGIQGWANAGVNI